MKPGLYLYAMPSGSRVVLRIGWLRRVPGEDADEYESLHDVTPRRGELQTMPFEACVLDGPPSNWKYTRPLNRPAPRLRAQILMPAELDPELWAEICPEPGDWGVRE